MSQDAFAVNFSGGQNMVNFTMQGLHLWNFWRTSLDSFQSDFNPFATQFMHNLAHFEI